jgi:YD repeat-containing protein
MYDRSHLGLRGLVKSCRSERTLYSRRCGAEACDTEERRFVTTTEYDQAGRLLRHWFQNPGGSEWNWIYTYDRSGRLRTVAVEGTAGTSEVRTHYYDEAGRLERIGAKASDADERVTESFRYDSAGRKTKTLHIDLDSLRPNTTYGYGVEGSSGAYSVPGARKIQTNYDERGKPVALAFYGEDQELLRRVVFLYDAAGQLVEEAQDYVGDLFPAAASEPGTAAQMAALQAVFGGIRVLHRYDEAGRRVETRSEMGRVGENCKTTTYNEQGDPESEQHVDVSREFEIDDEGIFSDQPTRENIHRSASHYTYVYDETGNWVELTIAGRSGLDDPFQTSSIETRALAYWVV